MLRCCEFFMINLIIEFISNDPTQNDREGFKSVLQKINSSEIIFGLIMDFTTLKNSGLLCFVD